MSREIKFRAYQSQEKKMYYQKDTENKKIFWDIWENKTHISQPMQYTGLKDKNGKDIYEGDIIELDGGGRKPKCEVIFEQGCWCIKADWLEGENHSNPELKYYTIFHELEPDKAFKDCLLVEVVCNVFENPELIKWKSLNTI